MEDIKITVIGGQLEQEEIDAYIAHRTSVNSQVHHSSQKIPVGKIIRKFFQ